jgi:RimJ/RimL family protein N-acetyltransferase
MNLDVLNPEPAAPSPAPHAGHALAHYATALIDVRTLPDGRRVLLRPVLPQDAPLLAGLVARLSATARRNRFHGAVDPSAAQFQRMARPADAGDLALAITAGRGADEHVIADARYCVDADAQGAEFALVVDERWQRLGLGRWAMHTLGDAAQAAGLTWLHGEVLSGNAPMRALMQRCGLSWTPDPEDDRLAQVQLRLHHASSARSSAPALRCHGALARLARLAHWRPPEHRVDPKHSTGPIGSAS